MDDPERPAQKGYITLAVVALCFAHLGVVLAGALLEWTLVLNIALLIFPGLYVLHIVFECYWVGTQPPLQQHPATTVTKAVLAHGQTLAACLLMVVLFAVYGPLFPEARSGLSLAVWISCSVGLLVSSVCFVIPETTYTSGTLWSSVTIVFCTELAKAKMLLTPEGDIEAIQFRTLHPALIALCVVGLLCHLLSRVKDKAAADGVDDRDVSNFIQGRDVLRFLVGAHAASFMGATLVSLAHILVPFVAIFKSPADGSASLQAGICVIALVSNSCRCIAGIVSTYNATRVSDLEIRFANRAQRAAMDESKPSFSRKCLNLVLGFSAAAGACTMSAVGILQILQANNAGDVYLFGACLIVHGIADLACLYQLVRPTTALACQAVTIANSSGIVTFLWYISCFLTITCPLYYIGCSLCVFALPVSWVTNGFIMDLSRDAYKCVWLIAVSIFSSVLSAGNMAECVFLAFGIQQQLESRRGWERL